jgi:hypothetical protein
MPVVFIVLNVLSKADNFCPLYLLTFLKNYRVCVCVCVCTCACVCVRGTTVEIIYNTDTCELFSHCMENFETLV